MVAGLSEPGRVGSASRVLRSHPQPAPSAISGRQPRCILSTMRPPDVLEVTITHNLRNPTDVEELLLRRWIAIDFGGNWEERSKDPSEHTGRVCTDLTLFLNMKKFGAAVIAAYKGATSNKSERLVGRVKQGAEFTYLNGLLCLPLSDVTRRSAATSFLGNLAPRHCTMQPCADRAKGRLAALVNGIPLKRSFESLHHRDVEWLVTHYLVHIRRCRAVWSGGKSFESVDHIAWSESGDDVLAQTTISESLKTVQHKADLLLNVSSASCERLMFCPGSTHKDVRKGLEYISVEEVFAELDKTPEGRWLIDRMLLPTLQEPSHATEVA